VDLVRLGVETVVDIKEEDIPGSLWRHLDSVSLRVSARCFEFPDCCEVFPGRKARCGAEKQSLGEQWWRNDHLFFGDEDEVSRDTAESILDIVEIMFVCYLLRPISQSEREVLLDSLIDVIH
jgi:hypothetical protein